MPTFDNTIVAIERSGELLSRVSTIFFNLSGCNTNPEMQKLQRSLAPKLAAHRDAITLNPALFARIDALYSARDTLGLDPESARLLWRYYRDFVRAGAKLSPADKEKLKVLNGELATLGTSFTQNTLKEVAASSVFVDTREELAGLSDAEIAAAAAAAAKHGHEGKFELILQNTTGQPMLTNLTNRAVREKVMAASLARGSRGGEFDTRAIVSAIAQKRAERANLLGFPTYAAYSLEEQTAGSVDVVNKMLAQLGPPPWPTRAARPPTCRRSSTRNTAASSSAPATGSFTRRRSARRNTISTSPSSSPTTSSTTSSSTASSSPPIRNTASPSRSATTCRSTSRPCACSTCSTPTASSSRSSSATITPAPTKTAARG